MKKLFFGLTLVSILVMGIVSNTYANTSVPSFPSCQTLTSKGDWASNHDGLHDVVGRDEHVFGNDDVYSMSDNNFVQCLCPKDSETGIQTNWWFITGKEIDKNYYTSNGWFLENGSDWNLKSGQYLAKNTEYNCRVKETPTPTPTATPSTSHSSECVLLSASTTAGTAPLTIQFHANGNDSAGFVQEYEFDFGDSSGGQSQIVKQTFADATHRYENSGNYTARMMVKDSKGNWKASDKCQVNINVSSKPQVLGANTAKVLPKTGFNTIVVLVSSVVTVAGGLMYKKFSRN